MSDSKSPKSPKSDGTASPKSPAAASSPGAAGPGDIAVPIEVDTTDGESTYASSLVTDTTSLRSSILAYKWENGRRYHAYEDGAYWAPNDERQQEAEDLSHEMYKIVLDNKLTLAPVADNVQRVLDLGCGTGAWAIEFADEYPSAEVIGVDLSPIQPPFVPPNCKFEVDDITKDFTYPENYFDYIHIRSLVGCIPNWVEFHKKVLRHLKPGGWVEHGEYSSIARSEDGTIKPDAALVQWVEVFKKIGEMTGKTFAICETMPDVFRDAGYVNIQERRMKIPIGTWPKDPMLKSWGAWNRQFLLQGLEGFSIRGLTELLGWGYEDAQLYIMNVRKELTDPKIHSYVELTFMAAQKSLDGPEAEAAQ